MNTVVVNNAQRQQVLAITSEIEFRDEAGILVALGRKVANPRQVDLPADWPSDEELERIAREDNGRHTPEQVMARLRELTKCS